MTLPTGTVTFLFTDIEGSTRLWEEHPEPMRAALARHDALLRQAIEQCEGHVFKTIGDAFCAAFHTASDALAAAHTAQLALISEVWPAPVVIKVRMALHTGAAECRDNDYFGQALNRVARLLAAGHGGQALLSLPAEELTRDTLPPSVSLKAMGEYRLRDLSRPETVFQLLHPALPSEFPPLKSLDYLPNNLPLQLTSFVGREKEMAEVKSLLSHTRLLTLTGSGGSGKTRLSLQVAADLLDQYPDGVWLVELAPLADPALMPQTVAQALGMAEQAGKSYTQTLIESLKSKRLLLLLDNCEHLLSACAHLADTLLRACPHVKILASSREGLGIAGEQTYRIPSLSLPDLNQPATIQSVGQYEAVRLFVERALFHLPAFAVTNSNAPALASVCHRLDGIPLAIELAAARVRSLPVEEINTRLDNRFRLLTGGSKTALPRQQTLRALIDWSYDLLNAQERALLARLSVFAGGWTLPAAEHVCLGESMAGESIEDWEVLDLLTSLADKSLVVVSVEGAATRYRLLETVRQYARDRLVESAEGGSVQERHRDHFLTLATEVQPNLRGPKQSHWLAVLEAEHDNLRQALRFCLEEEEGSKAGLRLGSALQYFWRTRGHLSEGRQHLKAVLSHPWGPELRQARAEVLTAAGILAAIQGDPAEALTLYQESLAISQELGDKNGIADVLTNWGTLAVHQNDYAAARPRYQEALDIKHELGDRPGIALVQVNLVNVSILQGDYAAARSLQEKTLALYQELEDRTGIAQSFLNLGRVASYQSDFIAARGWFEESLAIRRDLGDRQGIAFCLGNLGAIACLQSDFARARALQEESLVIRREMGDKLGIAHALVILGNVALLQGDPVSTRSWNEECLAIFRDLGDRQGIAVCLNNLGNVAEEEGDYPAAQDRYQESLATCREVGDKHGAAVALFSLAGVAYAQGAYPAVQPLLEECLALRWELGDKAGIAASLGLYAALAYQEQQAHRAARMWGTEMSLRAAIGFPRTSEESRKYEEQSAETRASLGDPAFTAAWEAGHAMTLEEAVAYAREE